LYRHDIQVLFRKRCAHSYIPSVDITLLLPSSCSFNVKTFSVPIDSIPAAGFS
jgi:hypothetical protein